MTAEASPATPLARLLEVYGDRVEGHHGEHGDETACVERGAVGTVMGFLRSDPATAFDLLADLMQRPGRVCSREQLLERVWGYDQPGMTRTVDVRAAAPEEAGTDRVGFDRDRRRRRLPVQG